MALEGNFESLGVAASARQRGEEARSLREDALLAAEDLGCLRVRVEEMVRRLRESERARVRGEGMLARAWTGPLGTGRT